MKQTDSVANGIALLAVLSATTIDCVLSPINVSSLLVGVKQWISRLWLCFVAARREFRAAPEAFAIIVKETRATR
jgi:hypothetical protein